MKFFLAVVLGLATTVATAQTPAYFFRTDIPVQHDTVTLNNAWTGGFNSPQFSTIDLNQDGTADLFVFDRTNFRISTFLAVQENGNWKWKYTPEYANHFPAGIIKWALLADFDNDGRKDIFCNTQLGIRIYRNISTPQTGLEWELVVPLLNYSNGSSIPFISSDLPAISDIDNDGDLDILTAEGGRVTYSRNMSIETTGAPGVSTFVRETSQWGGIKECDCTTFVFGPTASCRVAASAGAQGQLLHSGNTLLAIDLDGDLDKDLLWAETNCTTLIKMENLGTPTDALMQSFSTNFPDATTPANVLNFPAAYYEDVNFDGEKDLIVAPNVLGALSDSVINFGASSWLYLNTGTTANPVFSFAKKNFLQDEMIEMGEGAAPAFADVDGDGDLDMLVGNFNGHTSLGIRASLALYTNTGTPTDPSFTLTDSDFLNLASHRFFNIRPAFADIDADEKKDLYITSTKYPAPATPSIGRMQYFLNTAPAGQPMNFGTMQTLDIGITDNVDDVPVFTDVDNDGVQDVLVGKGIGNIQYYRNTGSNQSPQYTLVTGSFGGITLDFYRTKPSLAIADANGDGFPDMVVADDSGAVRIFSNYRMQTAPFTSDVRFVFDSTTSTRFTPYFGRQLSVAAADLDADGRPEIVVGTQAGGLVILTRTSDMSALEQEHPKWQVEVFPNPAYDQVQIRSSEPMSVVMHDMLGRQMYQEVALPGQLEKQLDVSRFAPGVYLLRLETANGKSQVKRLVVTR